MRTAVLGSINIDLVASAGRLPTPGETIGGGAFRREPGGKGANQAHAAAQLGADVTMFGAVGADEDGDFALARLRVVGVDTGFVLRVSAPTGVALIATDAAGENQIVVCSGANQFAVPPQDTEFDLLIAQLETPLDVVEAAFAATSAFAVLNASPARDLPAALIERADLIVVNEHEHRTVAGLNRVKRVVVTYGGGGSELWMRGERVVAVAAVPVQPVNSVGAGDAYCAAVSLALASGVPPRRALATASAVGAAAVSDASSQPTLLSLNAYEPAR
ncbi:PfkB family carbohydrate kinase [Diaminobutyricibacter sp. McL0618]|uniref:PfkB family carbohydrate kinase n=1 Tax=Leifsonia sp. McL0618 TaxID=3415677 RepID=UPI003CFB2E8F